MNQNFGITLIKSRKAIGLTQQQIAKRAGVSQSIISKIEKQNLIPRLDVAIRIWKALGFKIEIKRS